MTAKIGSKFQLLAALWLRRKLNWFQPLLEGCGSQLGLGGFSDSSIIFHNVIDKYRCTRSTKLRLKFQI